MIGCKKEKLDFNYYARINSDYLENFDIVLDDLSQYLFTADALFGKSFRINLQKLKELVSKKLANNPYYLVKKNDND